MALESCVFLHSGLDTEQVRAHVLLVTILNAPSDLQCVCPSLYRTWSTFAVAAGSTCRKAAAVVHLILVLYLLLLLVRIQLISFSYIDYCES